MGARTFNNSLKKQKSRQPRKFPKQSQRRAFVTGIAGQDGSYLSEFLVSKEYEVFGLMKDGVQENADSFEALKKLGKAVTLISGDITDTPTVKKLLAETRPNEIYNLASQSNVWKSFDDPEGTMEINFHAFKRLSDAALKLDPKVRILQASSSEMFGNVPAPQKENSPMEPVSPYAKSKLRAFREVVLPFREKNFFIASGIFFNHESPRRPIEFVTQKIATGMAKISLGQLPFLELGNLNARRDWGFAGDYVKAMNKILNYREPDDFCIATGESHTIRDFVNEAAKVFNIKLEWRGKDSDEVALDENGKTVVKVNKDFYRPMEVSDTVGDANKAKRLLGWSPETKFPELVSMMVLAALEREKKVK